PCSASTRPARIRGSDYWAFSVLVSWTSTSTGSWEGRLGSHSHLVSTRAVSTYPGRVISIQPSQVGQVLRTEPTNDPSLNFVRDEYAASIVHRVTAMLRLETRRSSGSWWRLLGTAG